MPNKEELIAKIHDVFKGVKLQTGIGLNQSIGIDRYATNEEIREIGNKDEKSDWTLLIDSTLLKSTYSIGGLLFFDPKGLSFHLPAYMVTVINNPVADIGETLHFTLTNLNEHNLNRFKILTQEQKYVVGEFLNYISKDDNYQYRKDEAMESITNFWAIEERTS